MHLNEFEDLVPNFLLYVRTEKKLSDNTYRAYACDLQKFISFWKNNNITLAPKTIILKDAIKKFRTNLQKQKLKQTTIARKLSCFNSYERFCQTQGIHLQLELVRPYVPMKTPQSLTVDEINFLLDTITIEQIPSQKPYRDGAIFELLYATGILCSELINIQVGHINLENCSIIIHRPRKKHRIVYFSEQAQQKLKLYMQHERKNVEKTNEFFFLNYRYQPLTSRSIQRICNMFGNFLSTKKIITPHLLRHSFALHLIEQGTKSTLVQELLGFSSRASIEKYLQ